MKTHILSNFHSNYSQHPSHDWSAHLHIEIAFSSFNCYYKLTGMLIYQRLYGFRFISDVCFWPFGGGFGIDGLLITYATVTLRKRRKRDNGVARSRWRDADPYGERYWYCEMDSNGESDLWILNELGGIAFDRNWHFNPKKKYEFNIV